MPESASTGRLELVRSKARPARGPLEYRAYTRKHLDQIPQVAALPESERIVMKAVSAVLPFRANNYVIDCLIDWSDLPADPIFQLTFPQPEMLSPADLTRMVDLVRGNAGPEAIRKAAREVQLSLNPHPAGQLELNVPMLDGRRLEGMQHKYRETVLFFPAAGQTCHAYCTYCFRWAQFVGVDELKFANRQADSLVSYLRHHPEVTDVLFTGGDPMIMKTAVLERYVEPLLGRGLEHIRSIRFGTKAPAYWPYRFVTDPDSDDLMRLFEKIRSAGKHLALMGHYSHPRELETPIALRAVRRILDTGAVVRCQAPLIRHVNDSPDVWAYLWRRQVEIGAVPYYMFVERDTGPARYFEVPLERALAIFNGALRKVSGLARTVRGPSMSAGPGKVVIDDITQIAGERVFVMKFLQGRDPEWAGRTFLARYDPKATWLTDLVPAHGETEFFYEAGMSALVRDRRRIEA